MLSKKNKLEYLNISYARMTKDTIKALKNMTNLKDLKVNYIKGVDNKTLKIISAMEDLEELELVGCVEITNEGLLDVDKYCKHIRRMDIFRCLRITKSFISYAMNIVEDHRY